jgi:hypothetical protein
MDSLELRSRLLLANQFKEGDLAIGGTRDDRIREDARHALLSTRLVEIRRATLVDEGQRKVNGLRERGYGVEGRLEAIYHPRRPRSRSRRSCAA